jgi:hypothetical protein
MELLALLERPCMDTYSVGDGASRVHELMEDWLARLLSSLLATQAFNKCPYIKHLLQIGRD